MRPSPVLVLVLALLLAGCGDDAPSDDDAAAPTGRSVTAQLQDPAGASRGEAVLTFAEDGGGTTIEISVSGLEPGPHGFHVHKTGRCEADSPDPTDPTKTGDFLSAGGHLAAEGQTHGAHDGDLPSLIAGDDGTARLTTTSTRLLAEDVLDGDGSALMVHALPDNFGNVPERYAPTGPDETTAKTGDAGARVACAALTDKP